MREKVCKIYWWLARLNYLLVIIAILLTLIVMQLRVITHRPFFDECIHLRFMWLISKGCAPHLDFLCNYPVLGYIFTLPLFRVLPETPYSLFPLRFFTIVIMLMIGGIFAINGNRLVKQWLWGFIPFVLILLTPKLGDFFAEYSIDHISALLAVGAMVLMFAKPTRLRLGWVVALSLLSVLVTPKYIGPLFFGGGAYFIYCCRRFQQVTKTLVASDNYTSLSTTIRLPY